MTNENMLLYINIEEPGSTQQFDIADCCLILSDILV